jgi:hypothetical protein
VVKERQFTARELASIAAYRSDVARAARDTGYSPKGAERMAWELLNKPTVRQALEEKRRG